MIPSEESCKSLLFAENYVSLDFGDETEFRSALHHNKLFHG